MGRPARDADSCHFRGDLRDQKSLTNELEPDWLRLRTADTLRGY